MKWLFLLLPSLCFADVLELQEVDVTYKNYIYARDPLFFQGPPKDHLSLNVNTDVLKYMYWNTYVHGTSDDAQYRRVGLNMTLGARITSMFNVQYEHHSQHLLDSTYPHMKFPVEDSIGVKIKLFSKEKKEGIF